MSMMMIIIVLMQLSMLEESLCWSNVRNVKWFLNLLCLIMIKFSWTWFVKKNIQIIWIWTITSEKWWIQIKKNPFVGNIIINYYFVNFEKKLLCEKCNPSHFTIEHIFEKLILKDFLNEISKIDNGDINQIKEKIHKSINNLKNFEEFLKK